MFLFVRDVEVSQRGPGFSSAERRSISPRSIHPDGVGLGQSASIPTAAAASTARYHASAGVAPSTLSRFSPFDPSTCQTVRPELPVNAASLQDQPEPWRRWRDSSAEDLAEAAEVVGGMDARRHLDRSDRLTLAEQVDR
jgi:hypothetical protein